MDNVDEVYGLVWLRWSLSGNVGNSKTQEGDDNVPEVGDWPGIEVFRSIAWRASLLSREYSIMASIYPGHWAQHRINTNRFAPTIEKYFKALQLSYYFLKLSDSTSNLVVELCWDDQRIQRTRRDLC